MLVVFFYSPWRSRYRICFFPLLLISIIPPLSKGTETTEKRIALKEYFIIFINKVDAMLFSLSWFGISDILISAHTEYIIWDSKELFLVCWLLCAAFFLLIFHLVSKLNCMQYSIASNSYSYSWKHIQRPFFSSKIFDKDHNGDTSSIFLLFDYTFSISISLLFSL